MPTAPKALLTKADASIEWYWNFGIKRSDRYEIQRGSWLDNVYRCRERARAMLRAEATSKPCMAIWGPSQTGKSTLLSAYLDEPDDGPGNSSALKWSDSEPVRFVVGSDKSAIVLNPFNFASDASGCVSRFVLRESVPDPDHPVEIELAAEPRLMHALAVGYLSECEPANAKGENIPWNAESFAALLAKQKGNGTPPQRAAFEALQQLAETLDLLILSQIERYENLAAQDLWEKSLRSKMLQNVELLGSVERVEQFAFELLWDSWPSLTQTYRSLAGKRRQLVQQWGDAPIRCSYRTAAILLDIDSYKKCEREETWTKVKAVSVSQVGDAICIGQTRGQALVNNAEDFGLFQALVWELRIPVNAEVLRRRERAQGLFAFLEKADLLDFPGVANSSGTAMRHNNDTVMASPKIALTEVLKRGKTASIVVTSARNLDIDGFSILVRVDRFPSQPVQLVSGIRSWLRSFGRDWSQAKSLPLNLIITFCGVLVNQVRSAGTRDGLQPVFDRLKLLGHLSDPKVVSTFATNYPQFDEGRINGTPDEQKTALESIIGDDSFKARFGNGEESFREMFMDGGTDYVFRQLAAQAASSHRPTIVAEHLAKSADELQQLIVQEAPGDTAAAAERGRALDAWSKAITDCVKAPPSSDDEIDGVTELSRHLRAFINIDPDELDDIPQNAKRLRVNVRNFIEKQFRLWQSKRASYPHLSAIGLHDGTQATRILSYLVEPPDVVTSVETFFREWLCNVGSRSEAKDSRRFLAVQMNNALLNRQKLSATSHRPVSDSTNSVRAVLEALAAAEENHAPEPEQSPHYHTVIYPFLQHLAEIKNFSTSARPPQPGDVELVAISQLP